MTNDAHDGESGEYLLWYSLEVGYFIFGAAPPDGNLVGPLGF